MLINTFTAPTRYPYAAADTETHTYLDGVLLSADVLQERIRSERITQTELRQRLTVKAYAYIIYAPDGFAVLESFDEYARFCAAYGIKVLWWYNMPFDMSVMDWEAFARGMTYTEKARHAGEFSELASNFGARYSYTQVFEGYDNGKAHKVASYDLRNLLKGGLANNLKTFNVQGTDGAPIRKSEMDYQSDTIDADALRYMYNDAAGLWHLVDAFGAHLENTYGASIRKGKPDVLTASGLAKRQLLATMYPETPPRFRKERYQREHPMTLELDAFFRERELMGGGLVMLNPAHRGRPGTRPIQRFDKNSHYPAIMRDMPDFIQWPRFYDGYRPQGENEIAIYIVDGVDAETRPGFIPAWMHPHTREVSPVVEIQPGEKPFCIFAFELEELQHWYTFHELNVAQTCIYKTRRCQAFADFVDTEYRRKEEGSKEGDSAKKETAKLMLNGCIGKFAENPNKRRIKRQLGEDCIVRIADEWEEDTEEASLMHIVQGAYVTAMGRTILRRDARTAGNGRPVASYLYYTDTDSIHLDGAPKDVHPTRLGAWKRENKTDITEWIFLAPKTYAEKDGDGYTLHAKGLHIEAVEAALTRGESLGNVYKYGRTFPSLSALNVRGGKALVELEKTIAKDTNTTKEGEIYQ